MVGQGDFRLYILYLGISMYAVLKFEAKIFINKKVGDPYPCTVSTNRSFDFFNSVMVGQGDFRLYILYLDISMYAV